MAETKPCPKCKGTLEVKENVLFLPGMVGNSMMPELSQATLKAGVPVEFWVCSDCRFLELYYHPVS